MVKIHNKKKSMTPLTKCNRVMEHLWVCSVSNTGRRCNTFSGEQIHICHSRTSVSGEMTKTHVPLLLIGLSPLWNIDNVPSTCWIPQKHCGVSRQYLKELSSASTLQMVQQQAESHQKQHHVPYSLAILLNGTF